MWPKMLPPPVRGAARCAVVFGPSASSRRAVEGSNPFASEGGGLKHEPGSGRALFAGAAFNAPWRFGKRLNGEGGSPGRSFQLFTASGRSDRAARRGGQKETFP